MKLLIGCAQIWLELNEIKKNCKQIVFFNLKGFLMFFLILTEFERTKPIN